MFRTQPDSAHIAFGMCRHDPRKISRQSQSRIILTERVIERAQQTPLLMQFLSAVMTRFEMRFKKRNRLRVKLAVKISGDLFAPAAIYVF